MSPREELELRLRRERATLAYEVFYDTYRLVWHRYALHLTGSREGAEEVTDAVTARLWETWDHALRQQTVEGYAWTLVKAALEDWFREHDISPMFAATAAFARIEQATPLFGELREPLRQLEQTIGLYQAIAELPDRQFDITVLRFIIALTDDEVADILGCSPATVRSQIRYIRKKLETKLFGPPTLAAKE